MYILYIKMLDFNYIFTIDAPYQYLLFPLNFVSKMHITISDSIMDVRYETFYACGWAWYGVEDTGGGGAIHLL